MSTFNDRIWTEVTHPSAVFRQWTRTLRDGDHFYVGTISRIPRGGKPARFEAHLDDGDTSYSYSFSRWCDAAAWITTKITELKGPKKAIARELRQWREFAHEAAIQTYPDDIRAQTAFELGLLEQAMDIVIEQIEDGWL